MDHNVLGESEDVLAKNVSGVTISLNISLSLSTYPSLQMDLFTDALLSTRLQFL